MRGAPNDRRCGCAVGARSTRRIPRELRGRGPRVPGPIGASARRGPRASRAESVAASIVAPGFEPLAKVAFGVATRRVEPVKSSALAIVVGYTLLAASAAVAFGVLHHFGKAIGDASRTLTPMDLPSWFLTVTAACSGALMVASLRDTYVVGPLIALSMVPSAALIGCAVVLARWEIVGASALRTGVDTSG